MYRVREYLYKESEDEKFSSVDPHVTPGCVIFTCAPEEWAENEENMTSLQNREGCGGTQRRKTRSLESTALSTRRDDWGKWRGPLHFRDSRVTLSLNQGSVYHTGLQVLVFRESVVGDLRGEH